MKVYAVRFFGAKSLFPETRRKENDRKENTMSKKPVGKRFAYAALFVALAVVICAVVVLILAANDVFDINPFRLFFIILTVGIGLALLVYGIVTKGGYEIAVSSIVLIVGITLIMIGMIWWIILVVDIALVLIALIALLLMKTDRLYVERADEKADYKPYTEQLAERKAKEAEEEKNRVMPEIKSFAPGADKDKEENK